HRKLQKRTAAGVEDSTYIYGHRTSACDFVDDQQNRHSGEHSRGSRAQVECKWRGQLSRRVRWAILEFIDTSSAENRRGGSRESSERFMGACSSQSCARVAIFRVGREIARFH